MGKVRETLLEKEWKDDIPINYRELISSTSAEGYRNRVSQVLIHVMDKLNRIEASNLGILEFFEKNISVDDPWE